MVALRVDLMSFTHDNHERGTHYLYRRTKYTRHGIITLSLSHVTDLRPG
jgi:hypothetical protein